MTYTPWGNSDSSTKLTRGVICYSTPSHGGFHVSKTMQQKMPEALRLDNGKHGDGWYEEDCDWCMVIIAFSNFFKTVEYNLAVDTLRNWHPERYEKFFGEKLDPSESYMRRDKLVMNNVIKVE